ncbi:hypothetical protein B0J13DRAFT_664690 [Dactylonectria estremocensis]|uniref:Uncharacterized protein n=1 Tax=Dactylonectria estremocensis TaxID=1079267 RepID=A0A9P9EWN2_9HYPO|nr:hypothetical protein B0J13DRAFT_664690 [Dactylonectria estremocensis]
MADAVARLMARLRTMSPQLGNDVPQTPSATRGGKRWLISPEDPDDDENLERTYDEEVQDRFEDADTYGTTARSDERRGDPKTAAGWPIVVQSPDVPLTIRVFHHNLGIYRTGEDEVHCWTYASSGFKDMGQKELVITLRRRSAESPMCFPHDIIRCFEQTYRLASAGTPITLFGHVTIPPFLGRPDFQTLVFGFSCNVCELSSALLPPDRLHALALTDREMALAQTHGLTRVLSALGYADSWFPYPTLIDRDRSDCFTAVSLKGSLRNTLPLIDVCGAIAFRAYRDIVVRIPKSIEASLRNAVGRMPTSTAFLLDSMFDGDTEGLITWESRHGGRLIALRREPCHTSLSFVAFCPGHAANNLKRAEDGYLVLMTDDTWSAIRLAIDNGEALSLPFGDGRFCLDSVDDNHVLLHSSINPIEIHGGLDPGPNEGEHVKLAHVLFINDIKHESCSPTILASYTASIMTEFNATVPQINPLGVESKGVGFVVEIHLHLPQENLKFQIELNEGDGDVHSLPITEIFTTINSVPKPQAFGEVSFQLHSKGGEYCDVIGVLAHQGPNTIETYTD